MSKLIDTARRWLEPNRALLSSGMSLLLSAAATSGLGFAFWIVAARLFDADVVGIASAAVAAMLLLSTLGVIGLDALVITESGRLLAAGEKREAARGAAALVIAAFGFATALALVSGLLAPRLGGAWLTYFSGFGSVVVFALGVGLTGAGYVFDRATIGFLAGGLQLARNVWFSVIKLVALPALLLLPATIDQPQAIYALWSGTTLVSLLLVLPKVRALVGAGGLAPRWSAWRRLGSDALKNHLLNVAQHAPGLLVPVIVAARFPPATNAAFYVTWMLVTFLQGLPVHLTTALHAVGMRDGPELAARLRSTLRLGVIVAIAAAAGTAIVAGPLLSMFGQHYSAEAAPALRVLGLTVLPMMIKLHYFAVARIQGWTARAGALGVALGAFEVAAVTYGAGSGSLVTLSWCLFAALSVEAALLLMPVIKLARLTRSDLSQ
ncbi:MAG: hypothetical protein KF813_08200 [Trueperaceae bacterium]|nr:hypothetical protein [Trueperaceae bacterium]